MLATALGGVTFIVLHTVECASLIEDGMRLFKSLWGTPLFGVAFFTLTGLHMTHAAIAVVYLTVIAIAFGRGRLSSKDTVYSSF